MICVGLLSSTSNASI